MELRDCFKDELQYIKQLAAERANQNSSFGDFLQSAENDADVEFLFEHFAFLMARLRQNVDDAFPEITQNLLSRVWPTPIRPVPSTAILRFQPKSDEIYQLAKGSRVEANLENGEVCTYQLAREIRVLPCFVRDCSLVNTPTNGAIKIKIEWQGGITKTGEWITEPFRLFLSHDPQIAGLLQLWLQQYLVKISVVSGDKRFSLSNQVIETFIPDAENLILPLDIPLFWRLQLLQEYFHLPHVNDFITLDLSHELSEITLDEDKTFELIFEFNQPLLTDKTIDAASAFLSNCTPIINLYSSQPQIRDFVKGQSSYQYIDEEDNHLYQIKSIYSILESGQRNTRGDNIAYLPVTQFATNNFNGQQIYYQSMLENNVKGEAQSQITFIDSQGKRVIDFPHKTFFCDVQLTNGKKCDELSIGDICIPTLDIANSLNFTNITQPTSEIAPLVDSHEHWPIISYLSLSPLFLKDLSAMRQLIIDLNYHIHTSAPLQQMSEQRLKGIVSLQTKALDWIWNTGAIKRGLEMTLSLDPDCFRDEGEMYQFGFILGNVLPFCMTSNNFLTMKIVNSKTQRLWSLAPILGGREQI
ncbi:Uncharacterized protein conserved in bacteria [Pragia fontium]|uniref:Type VI secretion system protein ImpG n=2 Tax=Pragia fontium TaxID=82985 RepID=A0AAJ4W8W3_9GAMM|nr:type VI secretion system baseplate subunit TssF [Pragia fontium]AKJ41628.1 hypothetical protein QQ39_05630 [Pragia fontium]GKX63157.1 type VI secretion protein [Pragia fontium]SFC31363.1 type VI secretion system protein ImpG [Pragia fontium DSM 5563 = ATCC 49100]SUB81853.1 Uncharacterized protein conserved in bacteria [Pragia fontium]